eukprot:1601995-Prymnesium_polylepis.2
MEPQETRKKKLSKQVLSQVGALIYFMEYYIPIVYTVTCVMSYPPVDACQVVLDGIWTHLWANKTEGNTFGGTLSDVEITIHGLQSFGR